MRKIIIKRTLWIYCLIIILIVTAFLSITDTKNKIINKGKLADKAFEQICISYNKRLALAKQVLPIQYVSSLTDTINKNSIYDYVKGNMLFQKKLDSIILLVSVSEGYNEKIGIQLQNNSKEIHELKKEYHKYAKDYNTFIKQFPRNYFANILNFPLKVYYDN
ncbi:MAG: hypothetical protein J7K53_07570 [Bacteroidales bacterium]|nr:hypothetical protein [Bacteroidales bacterium]